MAIKMDKLNKLNEEAAKAKESAQDGKGESDEDDDAAVDLVRKDFGDQERPAGTMLGKFVRKQRAIAADQEDHEESKTEHANAKEAQDNDSKGVFKAQIQT